MLVEYNSISDNKSAYTATVEVDEPDECPLCKHSLKPSILYKNLFYVSSEEYYFYAVYLCTRCSNIFICKFSNPTRISGKSSGYFYKFSKLDNIAPSLVEKKEFPACINSLSPNFVEIYNQSLSAEHYNLDEIAGIGYRKSLEFLIKDFLIFHENKDENKVKSTALGSCINTMIDNPQLKIVASRATWLGNDQTHYEQKYTDKDIDDLKRLIKLSVNWIEMIYLTEEAETIEKK